MADLSLNETQRRLARHALGLPNSQRRSYRNYFNSPKTGEAYNAWLGMSQRGLAFFEERSSGVAFWLTPLGARAALEDGESLCPEDFPEAGRRALKEQAR